MQFVLILVFWIFKFSSLYEFPINKVWIWNTYFLIWLQFLIKQVSDIIFIDCDL